MSHGAKPGGVRLRRMHRRNSCRARSRLGLRRAQPNETRLYKPTRLFLSSSYDRYIRFAANARQSRRAGKNRQKRNNRHSLTAARYPLDCHKKVSSERSLAAIRVCCPVMGARRSQLNRRHCEHLAHASKCRSVNTRRRTRLPQTTFGASGKPTPSKT